MTRNPSGDTTGENHMTARRYAATTSHSSIVYSTNTQSTIEGSTGQLDVVGVEVGR